MIIAYLAAGFISGMTAAIVALFAGSGLLVALVAYVLGGLTGVIAFACWRVWAPRKARAKPQSVTQRN